ncbi:MAG: tetratricopeptide repeat protein [Eubacteriales bacterium]|nr:tetratricopeptide repeat protein [Eubacteriales bacterium]
MKENKNNFIQIANTYYNFGLERANINDFTNATKYLKKALRYNKYHINARNLLGLIFYEIGEIGDAYVQWIISTGFLSDENKNPAFKYLKESEKEKEKLNELHDSLTKFNQALQEAQIGREDLAMQHLYKVVSVNKNYVKAYLLLALLQVKNELYQKAGNTLVKLLRIDKYNDRALYLFDIVKSKTGKKELENSINEKVFSLRQMKTDDVILPKEVVKLSTNQIIMSVIGGFIIGIIFITSVINPSSKGSDYTSVKKEAIKFAEKVDEQNKTILELTKENTSINESLKDASQKLKAFEEKDANFTTQYTTLNNIINYYDAGRISDAAELYVNLDKEAVVDDTLIELLNRCKSYIEGLGAPKICELGTQNWNGGKVDKAEQCYLLAIQINPAEPEYMFLLGRLYQRNGRTEEGNALFDKIIGEYPASTYATRAKQARGY